MKQGLAFASATEELQVRLHGDAALPVLIYLPGLHGDWTLVSSFRAAVAGRARFIEFTYPRTLTWSLEDYARAVIAALEAHNIREAWLLAESFSSQVAWKMIELTGRENPFSFNPTGIILAGGFAQYPVPAGVRLVRMVNREMPAWMIRIALRLYANYARLRHRRAPETLASIGEFVARRTEYDRQAMLHRYGLILSSRAADTARCCHLPVLSLAGFFDPIVPWPMVQPWLRRHCPGFRASRIIVNADHNVLGTAPNKSAEQILNWIEEHGRKGGSPFA